MDTRNLEQRIERLEGLVTSAGDAAPPVQRGTATLALGTVAIPGVVLRAGQALQATHNAPNASTALGILSVTGSGTTLTINALNPATAAVQPGDLSNVSWTITG